jgi:hypothetical protein
MRGASTGADDVRWSHDRRRARAQSLVEFALVLPLLLVLVGGAIQFGVIFAGQNSLNQVARDAARWAATQTFTQCVDAASGTPPPLLYQADQIAQASSLIGYSAGMWNSGNFWHPVPDNYNSSLPASPPGEGVEAVWSWESGGACPPLDNVLAAYVTIRVTHDVPVLLPGLQYLPSIGTCSPSGCHLLLSSTSTFRMEPLRQAPGP